MKSNAELDGEIVRLDAARDLARLPRSSEEKLALRFAELYSGDLRYVAAWSKWMIWGGVRWQPDFTLEAFDRARRICREAASAANRDGERGAKSLASAKTVAAVVTLARSDRRIAATVDQWDRDPWLLNTPAGVVDLKSGNIRRHFATDYLTQVTSVGPGGDCPAWYGFLKRVTADNSDLQSYLQRVVGYCLTGLTSEQALFFIYGTGGNGKGVFTTTLSGILADYHRAAPIETFTASRYDRHPTELARLRAARVVTSVETEEGRRWAESRIKSLTGGDIVTAHFMRQDDFEYLPQFKLVIAGNHKPGLRSVDEAIRRRFNLLPFTITIPPEERDLELVEKLKIERSGILGWAIEGCLAWQRKGLDPPVVVVEATVAYLEAEDAIAIWLDERCEVAPEFSASSTALYASWQDWAEKAGEQAGSQKSLSKKLQAKGFARVRNRYGTYFFGLRVTGVATP